jgi:alkyl hydroperoxide reductase subunit AhpC
MKEKGYEVKIVIEGSATRLSDYLGKWVVLCFYPGDFTFV